MRRSTKFVMPALLAIAAWFGGCTAYGFIDPAEKAGPTGTNVSGAGTSRCPELCAKLAENLCTRDLSQAKCEEYCIQDATGAVAAGCGEQHEKYVECCLQSQKFICNGDQISATTDCDDQMLDWGTCLAHPKDAGASRD